MYDKQNIYYQIVYYIIICIVAFCGFRIASQSQSQEQYNYGTIKGYYTIIPSTTGEKALSGAIRELPKASSGIQSVPQQTRKEPSRVMRLNSENPVIKETSKGGEQSILIKGFKTGDFANTIMNYAWKISSGNKDFILTLLSENGAVDMYRQSNCYQNGKREQSYGYCQLNRAFHYKVVDDKRFWSDPYWQMDRCWEKYKGGTRFYGYYSRLRLKDRLIVLDS